MPRKMEQTGCSETSAYKLQTPGNYQKESIQHKKERVIEYKMCAVPLELLSETFLILRRTERDTIKTVQRSSYKVPVILVRF